MLSPSVAKPSLALLCLPLCAVAVAACGSTVSTTAFKGEQHAVAETIANLQADATASEEKKICAKDLAAAAVQRLGGTKGCEKVINNQVTEVDSLEVSVQSVQVAPGGSSATAKVTSTYSGRKRSGTVSLVKEGKGWKISAFG